VVLWPFLSCGFSIKYIHSFIHRNTPTGGGGGVLTIYAEQVSVQPTRLSTRGMLRDCAAATPLQWIGISCWPGAQQKTRRTLLRRLIAGVLRQITRPCPSINYYTMRTRLTCNALMLSGGRGYRPGRRRRRYSTFAPSPDTCPRN